MGERRGAKRGVCVCVWGGGGGGGGEYEGGMVEKKPNIGRKAHRFV